MIDKIELGRAYSSVTSSTCFTLENLRLYAEEVDRRRERAEEGWREAEAEKNRIQEEREKEKQVAEEEKAKVVKEKKETEEKLRVLESTCKGKRSLVPSPESHNVLTSSPSRLHGGAPQCGPGVHRRSS